MTLFSRLPIWSQEFKLPRAVEMRILLSWNSSPWNSCSYWLTRTYQYTEAAEMKNDLPCKLNFWSLIYSIYIIWKPINMPLRFQSFISARIIMINTTLLSRVLPPHLQCWASNCLPPSSCTESSTIKPQVELKLKGSTVIMWNLPSHCKKIIQSLNHNIRSSPHFY